MIRALSISLISLALAACNQAEPPSAHGADTALWTDPSTGCVYIVYGRGMGESRVGSLSVRFRSDGKPDCPVPRGEAVENELEGAPQ